MLLKLQHVNMRLDLRRIRNTMCCIKLYLCCLLSMAVGWKRSSRAVTQTGWVCSGI